MNGTEIELSGLLRWVTSSERQEQETQAKDVSSSTVWRNGTNGHLHLLSGFNRPLHHRFMTYTLGSP